MQDFLKQLVQLQQTDAAILEKRRFIDRVPLRINEVDEPLRNAKAELEKIRLKAAAVAKRKKDREAALAETQEKIAKMKNRASDLKTNKEYQAHLKEIESSEKEIVSIEEQILQIMDEIDSSEKEKAEKEKSVRAEEEKIQEFKRSLDADVAKLEQELSALKEGRTKIVSELEADTYNTYLTLLQRGNGMAVVRAENEICLGCDMNIPPQLFVEIRKNSELIQCPQCHRILYYDEDGTAGNA
ncbi:MAG TPA: C4-type zinc ribbon domain-containing protein [Thermodesulfovibrionales bacterium]|nr:C4-type zinc ribbon domain-containing protein [Thermodesulfovibrionales bacterium]